METRTICILYMLPIGITLPLSIVSIFLELQKVPCASETYFFSGISHHRHRNHKTLLRKAIKARLKYKVTYHSVLRIIKITSLTLTAFILFIILFWLAKNNGARRTFLMERSARTKDLQTKSVE